MKKNSIGPSNYTMILFTEKFFTVFNIFHVEEAGLIFTKSCQDS